MNIVLVSNNLTQLDELEKTVHEAFPNSEVVGFSNPFLSAEYVAQNSVELALIAAELRPPSGMQLLKVLRRSKPQLPAILFADTEQYRIAAKDAGADGYFVLPLAAKTLTDFQQTQNQSEEL